MGKDKKTGTVDNALRRMWVTVNLCCTVVVLSLLVQTTVWAMASFTDVRFREVQPPPVVPKQARESLVGGVAVEPVTLDPIRVATRWDLFFRDVSSVALGAGILALFVLLVLITVMVMVVANAAAPTLNDAVAGMTWAVIVAALVLPLKGGLYLPWGDGALRPYEEIIRQVDAMAAMGGGLVYYVKFLLIPLVCSFATIIVGARFGTVARNWLPARQPFLDPDLESEVADLRPTSNHATGRSAAAIKQIVTEKKSREKPVAAAAAPPSDRPITQPDPGPMPRRII